MRAKLRAIPAAPHSVAPGQRGPAVQANRCWAVYCGVSGPLNKRAKGHGSWKEVMARAALPALTALCAAKRVR